MKQPNLNKISLEKGMKITPGKLMSTFSLGQWDEFLQSIYDSGGTLILVDNNENPIAAFRKES